MIKDFLLYLKNVFSSWYPLILLIPDLFWIAETYFGIKLGLPWFIKSHIWIWAFLFLLIAWFNAWRKWKNEIDFEIKYQIEEIVPSLDEYINKAEKEISTLGPDIFYEEDSVSNPELFGGELIWFPTLKDKKHKLKTYIEDMRQIKLHSKKWKKLIFFIKNTGNKYDSNINVSMKLQKWVIINNELEYKLRNPPKYPTNQDDNIFHSIGMSVNKNTPPYRVKKTDWKYELRDLHIGSEAEIFYSWEWIIVEVGEFEIDFEISSKNTNKIIKKNIKINIE